MASGWNLWVWLQCIDVASRCCCKEVYRYPHNNLLLIFPTPLVLGLFLAAASLLLCSFLNVFSVLFPLFFYNIIIANVTHRTFEIIKKKWRSCEYKNYIHN